MSYSTYKKCNRTHTHTYMSTQSHAHIHRYIIASAFICILFHFIHAFVSFDRLLFVFTDFFFLKYLFVCLCVCFFSLLGIHAKIAFFHWRSVVSVWSIRLLLLRAIENAYLNGRYGCARFGKIANNKTSFKYFSLTHTHTM